MVDSILLFARANHPGYQSIGGGWNGAHGYPAARDAATVLVAALAGVSAPAVTSADERLREALLSDAAVEAAAMTYEPDTFIGDAPNADDALRDERRGPRRRDGARPARV